MYKPNTYINRLKKLSNKKLIEIATRLGLEQLEDGAKTYIDKQKKHITVWREDNNYSYHKNSVNFSAIIMKEFSATDDFGRDLSLRYRRIMSNIFPKYAKDYSNFITMETEKKQKRKQNKSNEKTF